MLTHVYYTLLTKTKQNDNNFATTSIHGTTIFSQNRNIIFFVRRERERERESAIIRHRNGKHRDVIQYLDVKTFRMGSAISFNSARGKIARGRWKFRARQSVIQCAHVPHKSDQFFRGSRGAINIDQFLVSPVTVQNSCENEYESRFADWSPFPIRAYALRRVRDAETHRSKFHSPIDRRSYSFLAYASTRVRDVETPLSLPTKILRFGK